MAQGPAANPDYLKPVEKDDSSLVSMPILMQRAFDPKKDLLRVELLDADIQIGAVEIKDWNSDLRADVLIREDGLHALAVDVSSDIEIGAVELKDAVSDVRATILQQGSYGALVVTDISDALKSVVNIYGDGSIAYDSVVTLATYTVPTGRSFKFSGVIIGGMADGEFYVKVGATRIALIRNSASSRTLMAQFWEKISVSSGGTVSVEAKNISYRKRTVPFEATINGYSLII
jgi:hypothetical protein